MAAARDPSLGLAVPGQRQRAGAGAGRAAPPRPPRPPAAAGAGAAAGQRHAGAAGPGRAAQAAQERGHGALVPQRGGALHAGAGAGGVAAAAAHPHPEAAAGRPLSPPARWGGGLVCPQPGTGTPGLSRGSLLGSQLIHTLLLSQKLSTGSSLLSQFIFRRSLSPGTPGLSRGCLFCSQFIITLLLSRDPQLPFSRDPQFE